MVRICFAETPRLKQLYASVLGESQQEQNGGSEIVLLKRIARVEMSILKRALMLRRRAKKEDRPEQAELVEAAHRLCATKVALLRQVVDSEREGEDISLAS